MKRFLDKIGNDALAVTSMFDVITDLVFLMEVVEGTFQYIYANKTALKLLNLQEDIYGKTIEKVVSPDLANNMLPYYKEVAMTEEAVTYTAKLVTIYGSDFIGETSLTPIKTSDGSTFILAIVRDVTERIHNERELVKTKKVLENDIDKQKQLEKLLQESEQRYKSLFENHSDAIFSFDLEMKFTSGNDAVEKITGYSIDEFMGHSFEPLIIREDKERTREAFKRVIVTKKPENNEISINHKDGHQVDLSVMGLPILVDGKVVGIYGIAKDITEIKQAQKKLMETKEELEMFWEFSVDPTFFISTRGDILKVNPAFEKTFEYSEEEVVFLKKSIIPDEWKDEIAVIDNRIRNGETIFSYETKRMTKSGKILDIISSYTPIRKEDGKVIGAIAFYKNVTEIKTAERELLKSQEKYKLITENAFDIIQIIDPNGVVQYVSPSNERILGYKSLEILNQKYYKYIHHDDKTLLEKGLNYLIAGEEPSPIEFRFRHQNGQYIWVEGTTTIVREDGEIKQFIMIARDITERKRLRDDLAKMAFYDYLTELPNRRTFDDRLELSIQHAKITNKMVAVMVLDGRGFKQINDNFGHDAGDAVIKEMANRLQQSVRKSDTVARLGGDEMAIILPEIESLNEAEEIAKRIIKAFEEPFTYSGHDIHFGTGIGISAYPISSEDKKELFKFADLALYEAKKSNHSEYKFYQE
jgi:diguanylate cyclase (GGDEF)-like protein/PAS domain S-box-containing protein